MKPAPSRRVWLIAYDIADAGRLARVARICLDYGGRVQKSLFECDISGEAFGELWRRLASAIDPETDSLLAYPICRACLRQGVAIGRPPPRPSTELYLF